jgi:hypothetical protein
MVAGARSGGQRSLAPSDRLPAILQIFREPLKPGGEADYRVIEEETARLAVELQCPHPYLAAESLTGPKEVWWFNGFESQDEVKQVEADYRNNPALMAELQRSSERKSALTLPPIDVFANHRPDASRGRPWSIGEGRFLVITRAQGHRAIDGTVFEAPDGTRFTVTAAWTREEAESKAAAAGQDTHVFALRPKWSMPAAEWVAADPEFWL